MKTIRSSVAEVLGIISGIVLVNDDNDQEDSDRLATELEARFSELTAEDQVELYREILSKTYAENPDLRVAVLIHWLPELAKTIAVDIINADNNDWVATLAPWNQRDLCALAMLAPSRPDQEKIRLVLKRKFFLEGKAIAGIGGWFSLVEGTQNFSKKQVRIIASAMFRPVGSPMLAEQVSIDGSEEFREFLRITEPTAIKWFVDEFVKNLPTRVEDAGTRPNSLGLVSACIELLNGMSVEEAERFGKPIQDWIGFAVDKLLSWEDLFKKTWIIYSLRDCRNLGTAKTALSSRFRLVLTCYEHTGESASMPALCDALHELLM